MKAISQNSKTRRVFAGLLAVWMSGIVFLFCCAAMPAEAQGGEVESCPLAKKGHCDKSTGGVESPVDENALRFDARRGGSSFYCCAFLPQIFDKARKTVNVKQIAAAATTATIEASQPKFSLVKTESKVSFGYRPRPLNRSGTYLKNRVFRI